MQALECPLTSIDLPCFSFFYFFNRKEMALTSDNGNEDKNERLRLRWLSGAVTELKSELAEILRSRNDREQELAEREKLRAEIELLRSDVAGLDQGVRDLGARVVKVEAGLSTLKLDASSLRDRAWKLVRNQADLGDQVSTFFVSWRVVKRWR